jgi:hypothetical protein
LATSINTLPANAAAGTAPRASSETEPGVALTSTSLSRTTSATERVPAPAPGVREPRKTVWPAARQCSASVVATCPVPMIPMFMAIPFPDQTVGLSLAWASASASANDQTASAIAPGVTRGDRRQDGKGLSGLVGGSRDRGLRHLWRHRGPRSLGRGRRDRLHGAARRDPGPDLTTVPIEDVEPSHVVLATRAEEGSRLVAAFGKCARTHLTGPPATDSRPE